MPLGARVRGQPGGKRRKRLMSSHLSGRRAFLATVLGGAAGASSRTQSQTSPASEITLRRIELPPKTTLWGVVAFFSDDLVEVTIGTLDQSRKVRGRFRGQRLAEFSWENSSSQVQLIAVQARAVAGMRELAPSNVRLTGNESLFVGFGHRPTPADPRERQGSYPHEAVFVGFILFDGG